MAIDRIADLCKAYGNSWITTLIPKLVDIINKDPCFHFKIAAIYSLREVGYSVFGESHLETILKAITIAAAEPVANIREVCVKVERDIALRFDKTRDIIKKHIASLSEDPDLEVRITVADILSRF